MDENKMVAELRLDEGERLKAYKDSLGYWTIGMGHLIDPKKGGNPAPFGEDLRKGGAITPEQSAELLRTDIEAKAAELDKAMPWWRNLSDTRQRVLLNMAFNLGVTGLLGFKNTLSMVRQGFYDGAARNMLASRWAEQVGKQDDQRAGRLAHMMAAG